MPENDHDIVRPDELNLHFSGGQEQRPESPPKKPHTYSGPMTLGVSLQPRCIYTAWGMIDHLSHLDALAKNCLKLLITHADYANLAEPIFPSTSRLAELVNRTRCSVSKAIHTLEKAGLILRSDTQRKSRGRFGVTKTCFTPLAAEVTQLPYHPERVRQRDLFEQLFDTVGGTMRNVAEAIRNPAKVKEWISAWERQRRSVADMELLRRLSLPAELLFLVDKGVNVSRLVRWSKDLLQAKAPMTLLEIVKERRWHLEQAANPGGYLYSLVKKVLEGKKIKAGLTWDEEERDQGGEIDHRNLLIHKHENNIYCNAERTRWFRCTSSGDVRVFDDSPSKPEARILGTKTVSWLDGEVKAKNLSRVRETDPDPGGGMGVFATLKSLLKGGGQGEVCPST